MSAKTLSLGAALALALLGSTAGAAEIEYTLTPLGGTTWRYDYVLTNNDLPAIDEFSILFDGDLYSNLALTASPAGWSSIVLQPGPPTGDGTFDSLALDASLGNGQSVGGFSVSFTFLASGTPGAQPFAIIDPFGEAPVVIQQGMTVPVPEPESLALLLAGIAPTLWWTRRRAASGARRAP